MKGLKNFFEAMPTSAPLPSPPPQVIQSLFSHCSVRDLSPHLLQYLTSTFYKEPKK